MASGLGGVLVDGWEVGLFEVGVFVKDFLFSHDSAEPAEDVPDGHECRVCRRVCPGSTVILEITLAWRLVL